jgi:hypothetical protein
MRHFVDEKGVKLKENCLVIDLMDSFTESGFQASVPSLLGLESSKYNIGEGIYSTIPISRNV